MNIRPDDIADPYGAMGYDLAKGAISYITFLVACMLVLIFVFNLVRDWAGWGVDDTDASGSQRSGLMLHTDAATGVQYLSTLNGALTPRLDSNGRPMIVKGGNSDGR